MARRKPTERRAQELALLTQTARGTPMGDLLRQFWQPVALSGDVAPGRAKALRILSEDLTLYRGQAGNPYLVAGHCPHRCTRLHTGWVEGEEIRCVYHGWKFDGAGQCVEMPGEKESLATSVRIAGYPLHEYRGLIFAFMGDGAAPEFDLPRKDVFEQPGRLYFTREQTWPCHWLQLVENSMDAVHVSFVHQKGKIGIFGEAVTPAIPDLEYLETDAGIRQIATRAADNVRVSDWTFPNNNHILVPGITKRHPWMDIGVWMVAVDDEHTSRLQIYSMPSSGAAADREIAAHFRKHLGYNPADHHDELFHQDRYPEEMALELVSAQDYVAAIGQGAIADRMNERLVGSDAGIALLRRIFLREMDALGKGGPIKPWRRLNEAIELQSAETLESVRA